MQQGRSRMKLPLLRVDRRSTPRHSVAWLSRVWNGFLLRAELSGLFGNV